MQLCLLRQAVKMQNFYRSGHSICPVAVSSHGGGDELPHMLGMCPRELSRPCITMRPDVWTLGF